MSTSVLVSLLAALGLIVVHLFSGRSRFLDGTPRSIWLSVAGGISVAYVFVHLLPELAEGQESVAEALERGEGLAFLESHVYLVALVGLAVFYGLDQLATTSRRRKREAGKGDSTSPGVFWLHISSFAVYNFLIGYLLLHRVDTGPGNLLLFFLAMALHFLVNDYGLREHHKEAYLGAGRWVIAVAVVSGGGRDHERLEGGAARGATEPLLGLRPRRRDVHDGSAGTVRADGRLHRSGPSRRETYLGEAAKGRGYVPQPPEGAFRGGGVRRLEGGRGGRFAQRFSAEGVCLPS